MVELYDPNELFAWARTSSNKEALQQIQQTVSERLQDLQTAQLGQAVQGGQPHVQPTDEYRPGVLTQQPQGGPDPQATGANIRATAARLQQLEEGQRARGGIGMGPRPVAVQIGPVSEEQKQQAKAVAEQQEKIFQEEGQAVMRGVQAGQGGEGSQPGQGGGSGGGSGGGQEGARQEGGSGGQSGGEDETRKLRQRISELEQQLFQGRQEVQQVHQKEEGQTGQTAEQAKQAAQQAQEAARKPQEGQTAQRAGQQAQRAAQQAQRTAQQGQQAHRQEESRLAPSGQQQGGGKQGK